MNFQPSKIAPSPTSFVVLGLPRSRTAWFSRFLTYRDWYCGHEQLRYMRSLGDVRAWLSQPNTGTAETGAAPFWRIFQKYSPGIKILTVRRPIEEVVHSLMNAGLAADHKTLTHMVTALDRKLDQVEGRMPNVLSVKYHELAQENVCAAAFEHCLPYSHDSEWFKALTDLNVQINFQALVRYVNANIGSLNKLIAQAREVMLTDMAIEPVDMPGMTIAEEDFDTFQHDCEELFRRHCVDVGESPENWLNKNIPLMKRMHELGLMQIMIGRSNGKPFGYLTSFIGPSLEYKDHKAATHGLFYAAKEAPGLGLKLQRAAVSALKTKGIHEVFMRDGIRGSGGKIGTIYRRIGAEEFGQLYRIGLEE